MQKTAYLKELTISATQKKNGAENTKTDVRKIQSWLTLYSMVHPIVATATGIDGDFGTATEKAVINFQKATGIPQSGIVNQNTFSLLCAPLANAFTVPVAGNDLRQLVVNTAVRHAQQNPFELNYAGQSNKGPWVRAYMDGNEGTPWFWCMGFVQTIIDQAASRLDKNFKKLMPLTYSCDTVGTTGLQKGLLSRYTTVRSNPSAVKPGDIFLLQKTPYDWVHTGIITAIGTDVFETVEGNTNQGGSSNGIAVLKRIRNFRQSKLDVFSIQPLVEQ
ncbi:peptidoglycan-binding protein [Niabella ginsenosidivorans]|uniref:Peptidoglycan-binding protein n=1 Tax=Niabella ginsenosidivorans TaxID=1176587 RepID=A0A1A9I109_9BACT|nr:peptidoglycan-binding protein [Niabella ginsenosidivorans]ANH80401.1 peptidoglycan-binding protein [Niabella ginsenosidivorans]